ncbi:hypothetical protein C0Q70_14140 [Pomacea canaliculata]|uniref:Uncharacterized protein n=1 Tax=Pomacea canaliculata TaxID=400727 RepID=A0A2T7NZ97_POMCA|nr:hypothetical protein C0Q70_14140 [Pomacea canaliculata]
MTGTLVVTQRGIKAHVNKIHMFRMKRRRTHHDNDTTRSRLRENTLTQPQNTGTHGQTRHPPRCCTQWLTNRRLPPLPRAARASSTTRGPASSSSSGHRVLASSHFSFLASSMFDIKRLPQFEKTTVVGLSTPGIELKTSPQQSGCPRACHRGKLGTEDSRARALCARGA